MMSLTFAGILWDNDGLLVDTERIYFEANRRTLQKAGVTLTREQFLEHNLRQGLSLFDFVRERGWNENSILELRRERDALYLQMLEGGVAVMPGIEWTLSQLRGRVRMGIVTSSQRVHFNAIHASTGLLRYFQFVVALGDYRNGKPDPDPYLEGLSRIHQPPGRVLAIEDSERGLLSAASAGLRCVVVPNAETRGGNFSRAVAVLPDVSLILRFGFDGEMA